MKNTYPSTSYARLHPTAMVFEVEHGLDTDYPAVTVWDHGTKLMVTNLVVETLDSNSIQITLPYQIIPYVRVIK